MALIKIVQSEKDSMAVNNQRLILLTTSMIPNSPNSDVKDSSFFRRHAQLPSPEKVRARAKSRYLTSIHPDDRKLFSLTGPHVRPPPVLFEDLGLFSNGEAQ